MLSHVRLDAIAYCSGCQTHAYYHSQHAYRDEDTCRRCGVSYDSLGDFEPHRYQRRDAEQRGCVCRSCRTGDKDVQVEVQP